MTAGIRHAFTSTKTEQPDASLVGPDEWNEGHVIDSGAITDAMLAGTTPSIAISDAVTSDPTNLSTVGTLDWVFGGLVLPDKPSRTFWPLITGSGGAAGPDNVYAKRQGGQLLTPGHDLVGEPTAIGVNVPSGAPTFNNTAADDILGRSLGSLDCSVIYGTTGVVGFGHRFVAPAGRAQRTLTLYLFSDQSTVALDVRFANGAGTPASYTWTNTTGVQRTVTIVYNSDEPTNLIVTATITVNPSGGGANLGWYATALA